MPKPTTELTEAEWAIIKAVWDAEPCTAPEIQQKVHRQMAWAYSTVRTIMDRMVSKGLLTADRGQHPNIYRSAVSREQAQRGELFYALKHAFNGALTPMVQCLLDSGKFSVGELAELEALIKAKARLEGERPREPKHQPQIAEEVRAREDARPPKVKDYEHAARNAERLGRPRTRVCVADALAVQPTHWSVVRSGPGAETETAAGGALCPVAVVVVKVLLPPTLAFPTGPSWWLRPAHHPGRASVLASPNFQGDGRDQGSRGRSPSQRSGLDDAPDQSPLPSIVAPVLVAPFWPRLSLAAWVFIGMTAVSFGLFAWMLMRWYQVARDARRAVPAPAWVGELLPERQRPARIRLIDRPQSPAVCELFRPVILLPRSLAEQLPPAQLRAVLLHELVHLRRGDVWVNCLQALVQIVYWWHPLLWLANARIRRVREEAVDDAVMLALKEDAETYAPTLLEVAKLSLRRPLASLGLVGILESRSSLRQRVERLLDFRPPRRAGLTLGSVLAVLGFAALAVPMGEGPAALHEVRSDRNGLLSQSLSPSEGERVPKARQGLVHGPEGRQGALAAAQAAPSAASQVVADGSLSNGLSSPGQGRQAILNKLYRIRLDSVSFDGLPLSEVVRFLADESQKRDPEKRGINFLINQNAHSGGSGTPVATTLGPDGQLIPAAAAEPVDMSAVTIKINPALTNIWLADLLAAIVMVADRPIKFAIEDYAVVFSPRLPEPPPLYVRTFKISENTLIEGRHVPTGPGRTNGSGAVLQALIDHLLKAGVDLDPHRYPRKAIFYSDGSGMLLVRGTLQDLDIVEREIAALGRPSKPDVDAGTLVRDAKLLYEMDKLDEAEAQLKAALRKDPHNEAALYYLNLVSEAKYKRAAKLRGESSLPNPYARTNLVYTGMGRATIINKLNRIRLDSVGYAGVPLFEVVSRLAAEAKKADPEKRGINFLINSATNETAGLSSLPITINPPLKDVRLADVLDAIVKVAGWPMKYSIEDYAVVFSARTGKESPPLYVRTFKVDQNALIESLHLVKRSAGTNALAGFAGILRDYFTRAGVDLDPTRNPGKAIFYDDSQSMLRVRATMQDLDLIEQAIQILMLVPDQDSGPDHSSDWLLGTNRARTGGLLKLERSSAETWTAGYDTNSAKRAEVGRAWTNPVNRQLLPVPNPSAQTNAAYSSPGRYRTNAAESSALVLGMSIVDWLNEVEISIRPGEEGVRALGVLEGAGPPIMPQLARLLVEDKSPETHAKAAWLMSVIGYHNTDAPEVHNAVPVLTTTAQNKNSEVRIYSVQALGAIGRAASNAIPVLIRLTTDENSGVRMCAVEGLGRIGATSPEAVAALTAATSDTRSDVRITAREALERLRSGKASTMLTPDQARSLAEHLANEKAQALYNCQPFTNGPPARFVRDHWTWHRLQAQGQGDIEATVEFAADGAEPKVTVVRLESRLIWRIP